MVRLRVKQSRLLRQVAWEVFLSDLSKHRDDKQNVRIVFEFTCQYAKGRGIRFSEDFSSSSSSLFAPLLYIYCYCATAPFRVLVFDVHIYERYIT